MTWHKSDEELEHEWDNSVARKQAYDILSGVERKYQEAINKLRMSEQTERKELTDDDGTKHIASVTSFHMPKSYAGDDMNKEHRAEQIKKLIKNNKKLRAQVDEKNEK